MMGPKRLNVIRQQLKDAITAAADDPIEWLEQRMAASPRRKGAGPAEKEILQSLRRVLESTGPEERRKRTARAKE